MPRSRGQYFTHSSHVCKSTINSDVQKNTATESHDPTACLFLLQSTHLLRSLEGPPTSPSSVSNAHCYRMTNAICLTAATAVHAFRQYTACITSFNHVHVTLACTYAAPLLTCRGKTQGLRYFKNQYTTVSLYVRAYLTEEE